MMKTFTRFGILILCILALLAACSFPQPSQPDPALPPRPSSPKPGSSPTLPAAQDPQPLPPAQELPDQDLPAQSVPPLYFIYVIHTHGTGDYLPYDPNMTGIVEPVAANMVETITGMQAAMDKYGVKGTWEVVYGTASGLCEYGGEDHIFRQLQAAGHEVGLHAHKYEDIARAHLALTADCGIQPRVSSGALLDANREFTILGAQAAHQTFTDSLALAYSLGMDISTENLTPVGEGETYSASCTRFGVGNDMWPETGNLMYPWRLDLSTADVCSDAPNGEVYLVDHVSITWVILPGAAGPSDILGTPNFVLLQQKLDAALEYVETHQPDRPVVWGFVTHLTEYTVGSNMSSSADPQALQALDNFLSYAYQRSLEGRIVFVTASEFVQIAYP